MAPPDLSTVGINTDANTTASRADHDDDGGGVAPLPPFSTVFPHFNADVQALPNDVDPFTVNATTGFLPTKPPLKDLPPAFHALQRILEDMPVVKIDGTPGLLATYGLGPLIDSGAALPDLSEEIDRITLPDGGHDLHIVTALFRDYSFLASAYLLEPCWQTFQATRGTSTSTGTAKAGGGTGKKEKTGCPASVTSEYGLGRPVLPAAIARPLVKLAQIIDVPPFMSYAASYALYNYYALDPELGTHDYGNLRLIRSFERGQDPKSSEAGFILTHVHMVALTGPLVASAIEVLESINTLRKLASSSSSSSSSANDQTLEARATLERALTTLLATMRQIEANMERMWAHSHPADYPAYRTFIFGITSQPLFPDGVVYEGCFDGKPQSYRGESGANDSIIPLLDNICQIPMPKNPLTAILRDFRAYRPESQRALLSWTEARAAELGTREFFFRGGSFATSDGAQQKHGDVGSADLHLTVLYLRVLDHVRSFRWRHWTFAREYIIRRSAYPVATGGSPIVSWLPNQLGAVLALMAACLRDSGLMALVSEGEFDGGGGLSAEDAECVRGMVRVVDEQRVRLDREVRMYCAERGV